MSKFSLTAAAFIYIVDDMPSLTDLYVTALEETGYIVKVFNNREEALAALKQDQRPPDLLIMDYFGHSMPADRFTQRCRLLHPSLRILIASGIDPSSIRFLGVIPNRFIQKPFTLEELRQMVSDTLAQ